MSRVLAIGHYRDPDAQALRAQFDALILPTSEDLRDLSDEQRQGVRGLAYAGAAPFGAAQMQALPGLRVIANFGVGYDAIDVACATRRGITVTNTPDVLNDDVADLAVAMLIDLSRGITRHDGWLREGNWLRQPAPLMRRLSGRPVGILGMGRIGRAVADRLVAFGCPIHYQSRQEKQTPGWTWHRDAQSLALAVQDLVVTIIGGPATQGIVSAQVLEALGSEGLIVNVARGSVIDEDALIEALGADRLRGAALDVFRSEPDIDRRFLALPNVLLLPHIGSATVETRAAMGQLQRDNLAAVLAGQPALTPVN